MILIPEAIVMPAGQVEYLDLVVQDACNNTCEK
jgi:hypothetical protein